MGTRGLYCIRHKGKYYIWYMHNDAYPSYSGIRLLVQLWTQDLGVWRNLLDKMIIVDDDPPPITSDVIRKIHSINPANTTGSTTDPLKDRWMYLLGQSLRQYEITISDVLSYGYILGPAPVVEPECTVFIEWIYVINLDANSFTVISDESRHTFSIDFGKKELPLYLCDQHVPSAPSCYHCQLSSHAVGKAIFTEMFDMVVIMRIILWRNDDSCFPVEIWREILQQFGECCGLRYSKAVAVIEMTESSRCNHKRCLRYAILSHIDWLYSKAPRFK